MKLLRLEVLFLKPMQDVRALSVQLFLNPPPPGVVFTWPSVLAGGKTEVREGKITTDSSEKAMGL